MATAATTHTGTGAKANSFLHGDRVRTIVIYAVIALVVVMLAFPFYYLATTAFKPTDEIFEYPPTLWPRTFTVDHFGLAFQSAPFPRMLVNTLIIAVLSVIGALLSNSLAAFAIARLRFPLKSFLFACILVTLMIPGWISLVPSFIFWRDLGRLTTSLFGVNIGVNTIGPLVIRHFLTSAFAIFLMRQFFMTIPKELEEAARIDGASYFRIYWRIFLPLSFPVLAVIGLTTFMFVWNDLLGPLIYLSKPENQTVMVGLSYLNSQHFGVTYRGARFAGALLAAVPVLLLYFVANKYLIRGIVLGGIK